MLTFKCIQCGEEFKIKPYRKKTAKFCSKECYGIAQRNVEWDILKHIDIKNPSYFWECWPWKKSLQGFGYGQFTINQRTQVAHKLIFELVYGPLPKDLQVNHLCHNRHCCNPIHLYAGTQKQNMADMNNAGRAPNRKGSGNPSSKLTEKQVIEIRKLHYNKKHKKQELANRFGVRVQAIYDIINKKTWKHI